MTFVNSNKYPPFGGCADANKPLRFSLQGSAAEDNVLGTITEPRKRPSMAGESENRLRERVGLV